MYARALIVNERKQILMLQKNENQKIASSNWLLPGGTIEFGETPEEALSRELKEEINFSIKNYELLGLDTRIIDGTHWLGMLFITRGDVEQIFNCEPQKHSKLKWREYSFVKEHLSSKDLASCDKYLLKLQENKDFNL